MSLFGFYIDENITDGNEMRMNGVCSVKENRDFQALLIQEYIVIVTVCQSVVCAVFR